MAAFRSCPGCRTCSTCRMQYWRSTQKDLSSAKCRRTRRCSRPGPRTWFLGGLTHSRGMTSRVALSPERGQGRVISVGRRATVTHITECDHVRRRCEVRVRWRAPHQERDMTRRIMAAVAGFCVVWGVGCAGHRGCSSGTCSTGSCSSGRCSSGPCSSGSGRGQVGSGGYAVRPSSPAGSTPNYSSVFEQSGSGTYGAGVPAGPSYPPAYSGGGFGGSGSR